MKAVVMGCGKSLLLLVAVPCCWPQLHLLLHVSSILSWTVLCCAVLCDAVLCHAVPARGLCMPWISLK